MQIPSGTLAAAKETAAKTMIDVLHSYRKNCSTQSAPGQLVLPEALKLAPLYHLCLQKCPAFRRAPATCQPVLAQPRCTAAWSSMSCSSDERVLLAVKVVVRHGCRTSRSLPWCGVIQFRARPW